MPEASTTVTLVALVAFLHWGEVGVEFFELGNTGLPGSLRATSAAGAFLVHRRRRLSQLVFGGVTSR